MSTYPFREHAHKHAAAVGLAMAPSGSLAPLLCLAFLVLLVTCSAAPGNAVNHQCGGASCDANSGETPPGLLLVQVSRGGLATVFRQQRPAATGENGLPLPEDVLQAGAGGVRSDHQRYMRVEVRAGGGACLDAQQVRADGGYVHMWRCIGHENQEWIFNAADNHLRNAHGICLRALEPNKSGGLVDMAPCDLDHDHLQWTYDEATGQIKNRLGKCLDASHSSADGGRVHIWECNVNNLNQHWSLKAQGAASTVPAATTTKAATAVTTPAATTMPAGTTTASSTSASVDNGTTRLGEIRIRGGACLDARDRDIPGGYVHMWTCENHKNQQWVFTKSMEQIKNRYGICLEATQPERNGGDVNMAMCDPRERAQHWQYTEAIGQIKNSFGKCLDASQPFMNGGRVHMWECQVGNLNQAWMVGDLGVVTTVEQSPPGSTGSTSELTSTTPDTTRSFATATTPQGINSGFLSAVRNCYLTPLRKELGCDLLDLHHGLQFGLNQFGQETTGKKACLDALRRTENVDTFVHNVEEQSCELWHCASKEALRASAGPEVAPGTASVYSELCEYQEPLGGVKGEEIRSPVFVKLWEWNFQDIARECTEFLGPNGFDAVQISPVTEHILGATWWTKYQPVSFGLNSRSGTAEDFQAMVKTCRKAGVQVIVDVILNHIASRCKEAKAAGAAAVTPCEGWNGTHFGNRRTQGARGWDTAGPELFHHKKSNALKGLCSVGPHTGWLCGSPDMRDCSCCKCDMYGGLPDWNTELTVVREILSRHLQELHSIGVTMLRIDAALYHEVADLAAIVNQLPWDLVYQEWWGEYPVEQRTRFVGHYRDVNYVSKITDKLAVQEPSQLPEIFDVDGGVFGVMQEHAVYPFMYHDGRSDKPDSERATYKNGLEYHQQQRFFLAWPFGISVMIWGGYGWTDLQQGPPGCEQGELRCKVSPVFDDEKGGAQCMSTPTESPLAVPESEQRTWVCEHRWAGVAGLVEFRKACRGLPITEKWLPGSMPGIETGRVAFRSGERCFVAVARGHRDRQMSLGNWSLKNIETGLAPGRYCDMASLSTRIGWNRKTCPREVVLGAGGKVLNGMVPDGDIMAIYDGAVLSD
mmetsp:Transcript_73547/g.157623  ORF Transcript_73547/g.157623 Transcript_73547/m.157623 type:complete len:1099 (-) Transcript_73547:97-3393(-)